MEDPHAGLTMDVSVSGGAGGGMFGQVPVGMAGGSPGGGAMPGFDSAMSKLTKQAGVKPTIDSLPDKVKFIYSEMATQFEEISPLVFRVKSNQFFIFSGNII